MYPSSRLYDTLLPPLDQRLQHVVLCEFLRGFIFLACPLTSAINNLLIT
jgi:hypothetical protein